MRASIVVAVLLFLAAPDAVLSQATGSIAGVVLSEVDRPLSGVQVVVAGSPQGTITGADGRYLMRGVPAGEQVVRAEVLGYSTGEVSVTVVGGGVVEA
ncbi:MAG: hypothetical protein GWM90_31550, partial [Gemmatimonadetes bacterium]|nr:carboxypeptidase-like regulatory domain-containing protein [Gemmatimonadota bacterium]NIQ59776.1 carboxypeptidase-like regulatory domain-containing protein [Gemmatimonadota bacterium]NIU79982.1 hypothetical protein [Gammaproteobacteria bacterium]NIX48432.1 hypothetical protein [Gemmatimonadota bacterium]NIY12865.1 hypothetical protein [Gemmatimonadota bacterium]